MPRISRYVESSKMSLEKQTFLSVKPWGPAIEGCGRGAWDGTMAAWLPHGIETLVLSHNAHFLL